MTNIFFLSIIILWLITLIIIINILTTTLHPIILIFNLITLNILLCVIISLWKSNYIYSFLIFLIIIRGLLIIFIYFSRIVANEQTLFNWKSFLKPLLLSTLNLFILIFYTFKYFIGIQNIHFYNFNESNPLNIIFNFKNLNILNIYIYPFNNLTIMSIIFLLLSFFRIIKINSSSHSYAIRKIFYYDKNL